MIATLKEIKSINIINDLIKLRIFWNEEEIFPGQFFMIGAETIHDKDFILNRPFSVYNFKDNYLEFMIRKTGKFTSYLSKLKKNNKLRVIGPLGNYLTIDYLKSFKKIILLGGGIGIAPLNFFYNYLKIHNIKSNIFFGTESKKYLYYIDDLKENIKIYTEDGSAGEKGFVTSALNNEDYKSTLVIACGPKQMYNSLKKYKNFQIKVLLEERMACGFGVCLGCVVNTKDGYKRVCKEGPIFDIDYLINV